MKLRTREEKIKFLNQCMQGKVSAEDLLEKRFKITLNYDGYKIDGKPVTQDEWIDWAKANSTSKHYYVTLKISKPGPGLIPVTEFKPMT